jgi:hypothetical protein
MPWKLRKAPKRELYWVVNKETGRKYSKEPIPRERAVAQMRALYASEARDDLHGEGWFSDAFSAVKKVATTAVQRVVDVSKGKREGYSPKVRAYLAANGHRTIKGLTIRRDPIRGMLHAAINAITLGRWAEARKKYAYDKVFHLGLEVQLDGGPTTIVEKNEVINVGVSKSISEDTERMVLNDPGTLTLQQLLDNTQKLMGPRYFTYSAFENNCQDFIVAILRANNLWTAARDRFTRQPLEGVVRELPSYTKWIANAATDAAALADVAIQGRGKRREAAAFLRSLRGGQGAADFFGRMSRGEAPKAILEDQKAKQAAYLAEQNKKAIEARERDLREKEEAERVPAWAQFITNLPDVVADAAGDVPIIGSLAKGIKTARDFTVSALEGGALMTKTQYDAYLARRPAGEERIPYDQYVARYEGVQKGRVAAKAAEGQPLRCPADRIYDPDKEYAYGDNVCIDGPEGPRYIEIPDPNDPKGYCVVGPPGGPFKRLAAVMKQSECAKIQEEGMKRWQAKMDARPGHEKFIDGVMKALITIGDVAVEGLSFVPGVGRVVASAYKQFAPEGSSFYQPDKSIGDKIIDTATGIFGLGKGQKITMTKAQFKKEHEHLIRLLRKYHKADLSKEADDQEAELKKVTGGCCAGSAANGAFLKEARRKAKAAGLNWQSVRLSDKAGKKLMITAPDGRVVHFGAKGMGDHIHYKLARDPQADQHRQRYRARATKIRGNWSNDPYSPNSLAIAVLW